MTYYGTPDYDRWLDHQMEAQSAESDAYAEFCDERGLDPESTDAEVEWENFKDSFEPDPDDLRDERIEMELRDGE